MRGALLVLTCVVAATTALAGGYTYRVKMPDGHVELHQTLPPGMAKYGYELLNERGQVIEKVDAVVGVTEEQRAQQKAREEQKRRDHELQRLYSDATDAIRARDRQIDALKLKIGFSESTLTNTEKKLADLLERAANLERGGNKVDEALATEIKQVENLITVSKKEIATFGKEIQQVTAQFAPIIERLNQLAEERTGKKVSASVAEETGTQ